MSRIYRKNSFFSVIICTYNRRFLLERAIDSLLKQTFSDWEAIIADDGSSDGSAEFALEIVRTDLRLKYIYQKHRNAASARNLGLSISQGSYVTFLDSDDEYKPEHLALRKHMLEGGNIELLHGGCEIVGNLFIPDKNDTTKLISIEECVVGGTFFIKRELFDKIGLFNESLDYADDADFFERALSSNAEIKATDLKTYVYHRDTTDSLCSTANTMYPKESN
jgi:glycosyltransferase involved in cell wall biosynthesis